jgi:hypothetical protein
MPLIHESQRGNADDGLGHRRKPEHLVFPGRPTSFPVGIAGGVPMTRSNASARLHREEATGS